MTARLENIDTILCHAVEIESPDERQKYLDEACGHCAEFRQQVEELIRNHFDAGSFLDPPTAPFNATGAYESVQEAVGTVIGPYKLREQIGEGGFGAVFVAEQEKPVRRKVALKVIKPGMDTIEIIARFEAERQALALMDHPNVAKVLDAGATDAGRPYFVMELVNGFPITEFCDKQKLSTPERLKLFVDVCRAVQHAHQKGIIHRDIKPSNVMITLHDGKPVPMVIDFGVAKAVSQGLSERTVYTAYGQMIGTPLYMSPEQAEMSGLDIDTRTDVYSLGVLLYELLTGSTPFDKETLKRAGPDEMRRMIREDEPPRPSARISTLQAAALSTVSEQRGVDPRKLNRTLRRELDWIVMRAMEKDRNRRYESASALASDIERYLKDEPVQACPPSAAYRLRTLARRNKVALVTTALVVTSLLVGTGVSIWQANLANAAREMADKRLYDEQQARRDADKQRKLAEVNFRQAREAVDLYFTLVSESTLLDEPSLQPLRLELIEAAVNYYETFAARRSDDLQVQLELAATQLRLAQIYGTLRRRDDRTAALEKGFTLVEKTTRQLPATSEAYLPLAGFWHGGRALPGVTGKPIIDHSHTLAVMRKGADLWEQFVEAHPTVAGFQSDLSKFYDLMEDRQHILGQQGQALRSNERVLEIRDKLVQQYPKVPKYKAELSYAYWAMAGHWRRYGKPEKAEALYRQAISTQRDAALPVYRENLAAMYSGFAEFLQPGNQPDEAIEYFRKATSIYEKLADEYPHINSYRTSLAASQRLLADLLKSTGRTEEAWQLIRDLNPQTAGEYLQRGQQYLQIKEYDKALTDYGKALELAPDNAKFYQLRAQLHRQTNQYKEALADYERAIELDPENAELRYVIGNYLHYVIDELRDSRRALEYAKQAVDLAPQVALYHSCLGRLYWDVLKDRKLAFDELDKAVELNPNFAPAYIQRSDVYRSFDLPRALDEINKALQLNPDSVYPLRHRAAVYQKLGRFEEALTDFNKAQRLNSDNHRVCRERGDLYVEMRRYEAALGDFNKAIELAPGESYTYKRRAAVYYEMGRNTEALADIAKAIEINPGDLSSFTIISVTRIADSPDQTFRDGIIQIAGRAIELIEKKAAAYATRGYLFATFRKYDKALVDYEKAIELKPDDYSSHYQHALAALGGDDRAVYRKACGDILKQFAESEVTNELRFSAWTCALAPDAVDDYSLATELAELAVEAEPKLAAHEQCLGAVLFRAEKFEEAAKHLNEAAESEENQNTSFAYGWYFLAMTHHQLSNQAEARKWLDKAVVHTEKVLDQNRDDYEPVPWNRQLTLQLLRKEAESLIGVSEDPKPVLPESPGGDSITGNHRQLNTGS